MLAAPRGYRPKMLTKHFTMHRINPTCQWCQGWETLQQGIKTKYTIIKDGKKKVKPSLFSDDVIVNVENPKESKSTTETNK